MTPVPLPEIGFVSKPNSVIWGTPDGVPIPNVMTYPLPGVTGLADSPSRTWWAMSAGEPMPNAISCEAIYDARVIEVGVEASFNVHVISVVEPSTFLTVNVVPDTTRSNKNCTIM